MNYYAFLSLNVVLTVANSADVDFTVSIAPDKAAYLLNWLDLKTQFN